MAYTVGVIGCGVIGKRLGNAFIENAQTNLKYACDVNDDTLSEYCVNYSCQGFNDYTRLLEQKDLDVVYVGVPPAYHKEIVLAALESGKHVICEKPIALSEQDGIQMQIAAASSNLITAINLPLQYTTGIIKLQSMIESHEIGNIRKILLRFRFPQWPRAWQQVEWLKSRHQGGPLREVGTHFIFIVLKLFGKINLKYTNLKWIDADLHEQSITSVFEVGNISGIIDLEYGTNDAEENSITIVGTEKTIKFHSWYILEEIYDNSIKTLVDYNVNTSNRLVEEFIFAMDGKESDLVSFETATHVQSVIDQIFTSSY